MTKSTLQMANENAALAYAASIAEDVNETIRVEYRLGGSFTEQEVETLVNQALVEFDSSAISFSEVNELVDYNLIGA